MPRCNKCGGCIHINPPGFGEEEDPFCINCGYHIIATPPIPIEDNTNRRWESVVCGTCHVRNCVRGKEVCWRCWDDLRGKQGADRHAAKMAAGQAARRQREQEAG